MLSISGPSENVQISASLTDGPIFVRQCTMDCRYTSILVLLEAVDVSLVCTPRLAPTVHTANCATCRLRGARRTRCSYLSGTLYQNMILANLNARGFRCGFGHAHVIEVGSLRTDSEEIMHGPDGDHRNIRSLVY